MLSLTMPAALIATVGYSIQALGTWDAIALWGASMLIATATNWIYSELAAMFPGKPGGIALYAWEGWRRRRPAKIAPDLTASRCASRPNTMP